MVNRGLSCCGIYGEILVSPVVELLKDKENYEAVLGAVANGIYFG